MNIHETDQKCPFCGGEAMLTTEWGWIDETCTAVLCCPSCRTEMEHETDAVAIAHIERRGRAREEVEDEGIERVRAAGLPAPREAV